ncbi:MAG: site-specific integrase [Candidatus Azobacteroides sp.]|nr:site-specific integrase [Candidatus Azobacteroides sp.]
MTKLTVFSLKRNSKAEKQLSKFIYEYLSKSKRLSSSYKRSYRNLANHIEKFTGHTELIVNTDSFTEEFTGEFIEYLKEQNLMLSTVLSIFDKLKSSIRKAEKAGYPVDYGFENIEIKKEDSCAVYLTIEELERINALKNLSKEAEACRDRFLTGCFTALRISDYRRLSVEENFIKGCIHIKTQKTGESVVIPIHPVVWDIVDRNNNVLPKMPSQQSFGKTIKRICKRAGITEPVLWERTVGNRIIRKKIPKYRLVSSHTARRTGATNMYLSGISTARIMLLTGHKTEQSFFRYIRIDKKENARILSEHPFFKTK